MLQILTEQETEKSEKEMNEFLLSLDFNTKSSLVAMLRPLLTKVYCEHEWIDTDSYENSLPQNSLYCRKCHLIKNKE